MIWDFRQRPHGSLTTRYFSLKKVKHNRKRVEKSIVSNNKKAYAAFGKVKNWKTFAVRTFSNYSQIRLQHATPKGYSSLTRNVKKYVHKKNYLWSEMCMCVHPRDLFRFFVYFLLPLSSRLCTLIHCCERTFRIVEGGQWWYEDI